MDHASRLVVSRGSLAIRTADLHSRRNWGVCTMSTFRSHAAESTCVPHTSESGSQESFTGNCAPTTRGHLPREMTTDPIPGGSRAPLRGGPSCSIIAAEPSSSGAALHGSRRLRSSRCDATFHGKLTFRTACAALSVRSSRKGRHRVPATSGALGPGYDVLRHLYSDTESTRFTGNTRRASDQPSHRLHRKTDPPGTW